MAGKTVTFDAVLDGSDGTSYVEDPTSGKVFSKGEPVEDVDAATIKRLQALPGLRFQVEDGKASSSND